MQGCGNDFIIVDQRPRAQNSDAEKLNAAVVRRMSNRHFGVGCDQFIVMRKRSNSDVELDIFNTDGSLSSACGNATRCVARILFDEQASETKTIQTNRGQLVCTQQGHLIQVDMGEPFLLAAEIPLALGTDPLNFDLGPMVKNPTAVGMGNPHCVVFMDDIDGLDLEVIGPQIENAELFPEKTNVEFVELINRQHLRQRTWERGVGETLACGSGACAVAVAGVLRGLTDRQVKIDLKGGSLDIEWRETDKHVLMTGPADYVFEGEYPL